MRRLGAAAFALPTLFAIACSREAEAPASRPTQVRTARVTTGPIAEWVRLYGRITAPPDRDATLAPQVAGVLLSVSVREGESVKKDALLARVDAAPLDDAVRAAEAAARRAEAEEAYRKSAAERTRSLVDRGVASRQDAEADEAAAVSAEAGQAEAASALATARRRRAWAEVRAPFEGVAVRVLRRAGDSVDGTPATPVVQLASPEGEQITAEATAEALTRIASGNPAEIEMTGAARAPIEARVLRVGRSVDGATGTGTVRLAFQTGGADFALGLGVVVRIAVARHEGAIQVPARAIVRGEGGVTQVVVLDRGKAAVRTVTTGLHDVDRVEIVSGLAAGDAVVVDDPVGLSDGMALEERP